MWEGDGGGSGGSLQTKGQQVPQDTPQEVQSSKPESPAIETAAQEAWAPPGTAAAQNSAESNIANSNPAAVDNPEIKENQDKPENAEEAAKLKSTVEAAKEDPSIAEAAKKIVIEAVKNSGNPAVQAMITGFDLISQSQAAATAEKSEGQPEQSFSAGLDNRTLAAATNTIGHAWDNVSSAIGLSEVQKPQEAKPESAQAVAAGEWLKNATSEQRENYAAGVEKMDGAASDKWYAGASDLEKQAFFEHLTRSSGDGAADDARQDAWWTKVGAEQRQGYLDHPYKEQYDWSAAKPDTPTDVVIAQPPLATQPVSDVQAMPAPIAAPIQPVADTPVVQAPVTNPAQPIADAPPAVQAPVTNPAQPIADAPPAVQAPVTNPAQPIADAPPVVQAPVTNPAQPIADAPPVVQAPIAAPGRPTVDAPAINSTLPVATPVTDKSPTASANPVVSGSREDAVRQAAAAHLGSPDPRKQEIARNQISSAAAAEAYHASTPKPDTVNGVGKQAEAPSLPMSKTPVNDSAGGLNRQPVVDTPAAPNPQKAAGSDNPSAGFSPKQPNADAPPNGSPRQPVVDASPTQNPRGSAGDNIGGAIDRQPKADSPGSSPPKTPIADSSVGNLNKQQSGDLSLNPGQSRGQNIDTAIGGKPNVVEGQSGPGRQYRDGIGDGVQGGSLTKPGAQEVLAAGGPNKPAVDGLAVKGDLGAPQQRGAVDAQPGTSSDRVLKTDGVRSSAEQAHTDLAQGTIKGEAKLARGSNDSHGATAMPGASEVGGAAHLRDGKVHVATSGEPAHVGKTNEVGVRGNEIQGRVAEISGKPGEINARVADSSGKPGEVAPRSAEASGKSQDGMPVVKNVEGVTRVDGIAGQNLAGRTADGSTVVAEGGPNVRFAADSGTKAVVDANGRLVEGKLSGEKALAGSDGTTAKTVAVQSGANVVIATSGFESKSGKVPTDKIADGASDSTSAKTTTSPVAGIGLSQLGQGNNQGTTQSATTDPRQQTNGGAAAGAGVQLQPVNLPGVQIVSNDPNQVNATGAATIDPKTGAPVDPKAQAVVDPKTGAPVDPKAQTTVDPKTGALVDPKAQATVDPKTGAPIDPKTGLPVDPKTQGTRDPKSGISQGGSSDLVLGVPGSPSIGFVVGSTATELAGADMFAEGGETDSLNGSVSVTVLSQAPVIQPIVDAAVLGWQTSQISTSAQSNMPNSESVSTSVSGSVISQGAEPTVVQLEPRREANQPIPANVDRAFDGTEEDRAAGRTVTNPDGTISVGTIGTEPGNQSGAPIPGNGDPGSQGPSVPTGGNDPVVDPISGGIGGGINLGGTTPGGLPNLPSDPQPAPIVTSDPVPAPQHPATIPASDPVAPVSGTPNTPVPVAEPLAENKKNEGGNQTTAVADSTHSTHTDKQQDVVKTEAELTRAAKIAAEMALIEAAVQALAVDQPKRPHLLENRPDGDRVETIDQIGRTTGQHSSDEKNQVDVLTSLREIMAPIIDPLHSTKDGSTSLFVNPLAENEMLPVTVADNLQEIIVRVVSGQESGQTFIAEAHNAGLPESSIEQIVQIIDAVKLIDGDNSGLATEESVLANLFSQAGAKTTYADPASALAEIINISGLNDQNNVSEPVNSFIDSNSLAQVMENKQDEILEQLKLKDKEDERKRKEKQEQAEEEAEAKRNAAAMLVALKSKQAQEAAARLQAQKALIEKQLAARQKYVVVAGDTLESIAAKKLNNKRLAPLLFELNKSKIAVKVQQGKRYLQLKAKTVLFLPTAVEIQRYNARLFGQKADEFQYESATSETIDGPKVVKMDAVAAKRRANIEAVLGKMNETLPVDGRIKYVCRLGDSLRSIAVRHPALNDVSLWTLLARMNNLSCAADENGLPLEELKRGMTLIFPSDEEIASFRQKQNSDSEKAQAMKKDERNIVSKPCPNCQRLTTQEASICPACAHSFQECLKIS